MFMRKLLRITLAVMLALVVAPVSSVSTEIQPGLYATDYDWQHEQFIGQGITKEIGVIYGKESAYQFFYYDGSQFTKIENESDLTLDAGLAITSFVDSDTKIMSVTATREIHGAKIKYGNYEVAVKALLPHVGIYSANERIYSNLLTNVLDENMDSLYLISDGVITNVEFVDYDEPRIQKSGNEVASYESTTNKLTLTNVVCGYGFKLKITIQGEGTDEYWFTSKYDLGKFNYQGVEYSIGLMHSDDQNNLHITNGFEGYVNEEEDEHYQQYLVIGNKQAATALVAPAKLYDGVSNVSYSIVQNTFGDGNFAVEIGNQKETAYERSCYPFTITFKKGVEGEAVIKVSLDITVDSTTTPVEAYVTYKRKKRIGISVNLVADDMVVGAFNDMFSSLDKLDEKLSAAPYNKTNVKKANSIIITLPAGSYSGNYVVNIANSRAFINLIGANNDNFDECFQYAPDKMQINKTEIKGSLQVKGGRFLISKIDFTGDDSYKITVVSKDATNPIIATASKVGVFAANETNEDCNEVPGVPHISMCNFKDLDYAVVSTDTGIVCDVCESTFKNCVHGYYMDARGEMTNHGGDKSKDNVFIDCGNAVTLVSLPEQLPAYSLRFVNNYFINNGTTNDFNISEDNGTYYFRENYYGKTLANINEASNLRTVSINKNGKTNIDVITNPCIRYPGQEYYLGIDPTDGLLLRIFNGVETNINSNDINNIKNLGIVSPDGTEVLGEIEIGGDN